MNYFFGHYWTTEKKYWKHFPHFAQSTPRVQNNPSWQLFNIAVMISFCNANKAE